MTYLALPWFVLVTTGSPGKMSLVLAAEILPMASSGSRAGSSSSGSARGRRCSSPTSRARRSSRRSRSCTRRALLSFRLLLALVALLGCFAPPYFAAQRTILPELVGEDETRMSQANSSIEGGTAFAALIGPALAGALIPFIGASNVLYVDAATYLVAFCSSSCSSRAASRSRPPCSTACSPACASCSRRPAARAARGDDRRLRLPRAGMSAGLPGVRVRRVRRELVDRRSLLRGARRGRGRRERRRGRRGEEGRAAPALGARDPRVLGAAVGAAVPAAVAGRLRRALRGDVLHAARQRAADRSADGPDARRICARR